MTVLVIIQILAIACMFSLFWILPNWKTTKIQGKAGKTVNFLLDKGQKAKVEVNSVVVHAHADDNFVIGHENGHNSSSQKFTRNNYQFSGTLSGGVWSINKNNVYFELYPNTSLVIKISKSPFQKIGSLVGCTIIIALILYLAILTQAL